MRVRPATTEDAPAVAEVHVESWRWSYAGLLPQRELDSLDVGTRTLSWQVILSGTDGDRRATLVAEDDAGVCGFASVGECRDADAHGEGELYAIYLAERAAGRGVGHALLDAAQAKLRDLGFERATLWVLGNNARAQRFYAREGWEPDGAQKAEPGRCGGEVQLRYRRSLAVAPVAPST